jgi:hypothetical protein
MPRRRTLGLDEQFHAFLTTALAGEVVGQFHVPVTLHTPPPTTTENSPPIPTPTELLK